MKILYLQGLCAFAAFTLLAAATLVRRRRLTHEDIGPLFSTFMAASTLPVAVHLCSFVLPIARDPDAIVFPDLYSLYISAAGLILLVSSCVTICQLFAARMRREAITDVQMMARPPATGSSAPIDVSADDQNASSRDLPVSRRSSIA